MNNSDTDNKQNSSPKQIDLSSITGKVLLVDDNEDMLAFLKKLLISWGMEVFAAKGGEEAIDIAEKNSSEIILLLSDLMMPGMSGNKLFEVLHPKMPHMKVIYMSGFVYGSIIPEDVSDVIESGESLIEKPFAAGELSALIQKKLKVNDR